MNKYILELLNEHKRVIIPDFGAFILKQGTPKTYVFNEFLKYNDGLLVDYIILQEKSTKEEAEGKVKTFVEEINTALNNKESFAIEGIGTLSKDQSGKTVFTMGDAVISASKNETTTASTTSQEKSSVKKDEEKKTIKEEPKKAEEKKEETKPIDKKPEPAKTVAQKVAEEKKAEEEKKPKLKEFTYQSSSSYEKKKADASSGSTMKYFLWTTLAVILAGVLIYVIILRKETKKQVAVTEQENVTTVDTTPEPVIEKEEDSIDEIIPKDKNMYLAESEGNRYYVIAGCFREERNADNYTTKLRKQGFNAQKFGTYKGLHAVCFDSFEMRGDALNMLRNIRKQVEPNAWMLYYPQ